MSDNPAEFDTLAEWTADAARRLGADHFIPAACRGSGGPPALDWLLERLAPSPTTRMLDVGAGVGGPAEYARQRAGVRPLLAEPEPGACRAARMLFAHDVVRADATALPFPDASADVIWSLGVLDTLPDHEAFFGEIVRCLSPAGSVGLLAYLATGDVSAAPESNHFPDRAELDELVARSGLVPVAQSRLVDLGPVPPGWTARADAVDEEIERQHGRHPAFREAKGQERVIGELLDHGDVRGEVLVLRRREGAGG